MEEYSLEEKNKMGLFNQSYRIKLECSNCGFKNELKCKKGITVKKFIKSEDCKCDHCGCLINCESYSTKFIK